MPFVEEKEVDRIDWIGVIRKLYFDKNDDILI